MASSHEPSHLFNLSRGRASWGQAGANSRKQKVAALGIPDLRFERSYLRSIQQFIHFGNVKSQDKNGESSETAAQTGLYGVPLEIDWGWVLYTTARDQIISPFAQGALLAVVAIYLRPFLRTLGARIRTNIAGTWRSIFSPIEHHVQHGSGRIRPPLRDTNTGAHMNIALAK